MTKQEHAQALKKHMEGQIAQYDVRIEFEESQLDDIEDEEEKAEKEIQIDAYREKREEIKGDYEPFIEFIEENYEEQ